MQRTIIVINEKAIPKGRPRFVRRGNFVQTYTPKKTHEYEKTIAEYYKRAMKELNRRKYKTESLIINIDIEITPAKSLSKKKKAELISSGFHNQKPDVDNLAKAILDALNGVAYEDDSQIQMLSIKKCWSERDCITLTIQAIEEGESNDYIRNKAGCLWKCR